jgi:arylsulfatase A-like enzyme
LLKSTRTAVCAAALGATLGSCRREEPGLDLMEAAEHGGRDAVDVRLHDVVRRAWPARPPSRREIMADLPRGARLRVACGLDERTLASSVEFTIKMKQDGGERLLARLRLEPAAHEEHRRWVPVDVDLDGAAGPATLVLETRTLNGNAAGEAEAFWGTPFVTSSSRAAAPLVVVYLVDTLRADHTSPYGYARDTTPALTDLAADGVVFEQAIAAASWTKPSVASILTSQLPGEHGAVHLRDRLSPAAVTLPERLREAHVVTGASVANPIVYAAGTGFEQGFTFFEGLRGADDRPSDVVPAAGVIDAALRWLDERDGLPSFLYVHTMDPHVPYQPPAPFDRRYGPPPAEGRAAADPRFHFREAGDRERLIAQYDGEIAYGDQELGRFVQALKSRGLYDDALIVFTADHGEEFLDHGQWLHGRSVFDEVVRVPLIVKFPRRQHAGTTVQQQVQSVDILPTVLTELGLRVPAPPEIAGRPLQAVLQGKATEAPAISSISDRGHVAFGIRTSTDKYIWRFSPEDDELYFDLSRDPGERENRVAQTLERARTRRARLEEVMTGSPYEYRLRLSGASRYALTLETNGFIEAVDERGFGTGDRFEVDRGKHVVTIETRPRAGQPRDIGVSVRPMGAPVWVSGRRDERTLDRDDVHIAREDLAPPGVPFRVPDLVPVESSSRSSRGRASRPAARGAGVDERQANMLEPPAGDPDGLSVWIALRPGVRLLDLDASTRERLQALGYLGR